MLRSVIRATGIRPRKLAGFFSGFMEYRRAKRRFMKMAKGSGIVYGKDFPIFTEAGESCGNIGAYMLQDLTVARWVRENGPARHVDIGSRLDGFVANIASFRDVEVIDLRPSPRPVPGIVFHRFDITRELPRDWVSSTDSLSCLHTLEHFGLGRYGDDIDPQGHLKGLSQLKKMVRPGGILYLSTPIGPERVEFNAHRVFAPTTLLDWFRDGWEIERLAVVDDEDNLKLEDSSFHEFEGNLGVGILAARKTLAFEK